MDVLVVGDALLDVTVAPSRPMTTGGDMPAAISLAPGGQGANVAVRLARRGLSVTLVAPLADDEPGRLLRAALLREGVELQPLAAQRSGVVVVHVGSDGERTMLSDRAPLPDVAVEEVSAAMPAAAWLHCSGYALRDPRGSALAAVLGGRGAQQRLSIGGGSLTTVDAEDYGASLERARPDLLIASRDEATALASGRGLEAVAAELGRRFGCVAVVTGAAEGAAAASQDATVSLPAAPGDGTIVDSTGAGDAFAAAMLAALHDLPWPPAQATLAAALAAAARAGSQAVAVRGAQGSISDESARAAQVRR